MAFSFADLGFWPIAAFAFAFELLHLTLLNYWPALRGSQLGADPGNAKYFFLLEALLVLAAIATGVGELQRLIKQKNRSLLKIALTTVAIPSLILVLILVWNG